MPSAGADDVTPQVAPPSLAPGATFAYADPPYPGMAARYYSDEPDYGGEVDHQELTSVLEERRRAGELAGWALSTSSKTLHLVLPMCPVGARVCAWVKPIGVPSSTYGLHSTWEPLIVVGGRQRRPGVRDWLRAMPARGGGELPGRKPIAFCAFLFRALGMVPGDELEDLFPGTGIVGRAWEEASVRAAVSDGGSVGPGRRPSARSSETPSRTSRDAADAAEQSVLPGAADGRRACRTDEPSAGHPDEPSAGDDDGSSPVDARRAVVDDVSDDGEPEGRLPGGDA